MAIKKTELYSSLWASCDNLRGGMDASQYKDYVLTLLFMKYVSDKYKDDPYGMIEVPAGASYDDMLALKGDKEIGDKLNKIIAALAEANDLKGVIDVADFNDEDKLGKGKEMVDRLSDLVAIFASLDLSSNRAEDDDLLGDAYEYLMRHFATESGKSKGQFYTPSEVSRILAKVVGITDDTSQDATVYDPTCGSGSLLLKASDEAPRGLTIYGQEMDNATSALARMNMILHGNKNRLRARDIHQIVDVFTKQIEVPKYSRMVALKEISDNDYNLNIPRYIDASDAEDLHDLSGHLQGGIPNADIDALSDYWQVFPSLRASLFAPARTGYSQGLVSASAVKSTILAHPEFTAFASQSLAPFNTWKSNAQLDTIAQGDQPKAWIDRLSESLLLAYGNSQLIDKYAIYQLLMDYWAETLQDDVYVLVQDGWTAGNRLRELVVTKGEKLKETPDLVIGKAKYKAELIPPALIIARYFSAQQTTLEQLQSEVDNLSQQIESLIEEHSGDDGLLLDAMNDKDKVTKATVKARLKHAKDADEVALLKQLQGLFDAEDTAKKAAKDAQETLDMAVFAQYAKLSESDIKTLIVQNKWLASVQSAVEADIERITQQLANRVKELEERYAQPLPQLEADVLALSAKVVEHLKTMGLSL